MMIDTLRTTTHRSNPIEAPAARVPDHAEQGAAPVHGVSRVDEVVRTGSIPELTVRAGGNESAAEYGGAENP
jgi:hypothetical protein